MILLMIIGIVVVFLVLSPTVTAPEDSSVLQVASPILAATVPVPDVTPAEYVPLTLFHTPVENPPVVYTQNLFRPPTIPRPAGTPSLEQTDNSVLDFSSPIIQFNDHINKKKRELLT